MPGQGLAAGAGLGREECRQDDLAHGRAVEQRNRCCSRGQGGELALVASDTSPVDVSVH